MKGEAEGMTCYKGSRPNPTGEDPMAMCAPLGWQVLKVEEEEEEEKPLAPWVPVASCPPDGSHWGAPSSGCRPSAMLLGVGTGRVLSFWPRDKNVVVEEGEKTKHVPTSHSQLLAACTRMYIHPHSHFICGAVD
ncbi:hypothetical protein EYF80_012386 [Liparis tanakae]|uniref:Uncharacterized protein n=1 Tax=Liparis tanakae TaxID=230148 RepID=A0A4Z2IJI7_9TELE|nr:hypothetical protein EYF80_012386 [Liparis tanakae]